MMQWRAGRGTGQPARRAASRSGQHPAVTVAVTLSAVMVLALGHFLLPHPHPSGDELRCAACASPGAPPLAEPVVVRPAVTWVPPWVPPVGRPLHAVAVLTLAPTRSPPA